MIGQPQTSSRIAATYRQMARDLGVVVIKTGVRMVTRQKWKRTPKEQSDCLAICTGIEGQTPKCAEWLDDSKRCRKCGCFSRFASFLEAKDCPLRKWPAAPVLTDAPGQDDPLL